ncbi:MarR family transcriptional regulator [Kitasatospora sp. GP82]|uniref:MarR family winged helix-turn-helix transcriptional regulator n=1 Tax=Kitasatospora sp. GP82 TaxID=3035089 RepID=UPI002476BE0F|nr:MarR family transcriptional regulator [Kitasatospora sp. GP82]MDH6125203.1 DNA-binding MarR family transcriptional regulator [Kitasatospora sp. GP82]
MDRKTTAAPDAVDAITAQWARVRPDLQTEAMAAFGRIFRISRLMGDRMEAAFAAFGIGRGEFDVLATLRRSDAPYTLSPRELTATLMLTTGGMTGRLDKLERAGLVTRSPDPSDRRGLRITLTDTGLDLVDRAVGVGLGLQQEALATLTPEEAQTLNQLLRRVMTTASHP